MKDDVWIRKMEKERDQFFALCSENDRKKLVGAEHMTFDDYLRISFILYELGFELYVMEVGRLFPDFARKEFHVWEIHREVFANDPVYYEDEEIFEKCENWLREFCNQITDEKVRKRYIRRLHLDEFI